MPSPLTLVSSSCWAWSDQSWYRGCCMMPMQECAWSRLTKTMKR